MSKIAVLGPIGTYSDIACQKYMKENNLDFDIEYYPSIMRSAKYVCDYAILPFENTLDGFVIESLDQIIVNDYKIIKQVKLDIDFAFVTNAKDIKDVKYCYGQFKSQGQCQDFINEYTFEMIRTESNSESVERLLASDSTYSAIIPMHRLSDTNFNYVLEHIADSNQNETRFFVVQKDNLIIPEDDELEASILISALEDRSGILYDILKEFHLADINLKSIMSRPMKTDLGKYKFYMEAVIKKSQVLDLEKLKNKFSESKGLSMRIMGIYNKL